MKTLKDIRNGLLSEERDETTEKVEMAETQLHFICYAAKEILEYIKMGGEIEEWYQNKLSKVHSDVESLHSYVEGEKRRTGMVDEEVEQIDEDKNKIGYARFNSNNHEYTGKYKGTRFTVQTGWRHARPDAKNTTARHVAYDNRHLKPEDAVAIAKHIRNMARDYTSWRGLPKKIGEEVEQVDEAKKEIGFVNHTEKKPGKHHYGVHYGKYRGQPFEVSTPRLGNTRASHVVAENPGIKPEYAKSIAKHINDFERNWGNLSHLGMAIHSSKDGEYVNEEVEQVEEGVVDKIKQTASDVLSPGRRQKWADSKRKRGLHTAIKQTRDGRVMSKNQEGKARSFGQSEKDLARRYTETGHKPFWWKMKEEVEQNTTKDKNNPVHIEYWQQDTMESGRWVRTNPMPRDTAEKAVRYFHRGNIVDAEKVEEGRKLMSLKPPSAAKRLRDFTKPVSQIPAPKGGHSLSDDEERVWDPIRAGYVVRKKK